MSLHDKLLPYKTTYLNTDIKDNLFKKFVKLNYFKFLQTLILCIVRYCLTIILYLIVIQPPVYQNSRDRLNMSERYVFATSW